MIAGLLALVFLLLLLLALDAAGGYVDASDVYAALGASILVGAIAA